MVINIAKCLQTNYCLLHVLSVSRSSFFLLSSALHKIRESLILSHIRNISLIFFVPIFGLIYLSARCCFSSFFFSPNIFSCFGLSLSLSLCLPSLSFSLSLSLYIYISISPSLPLPASLFSISFSFSLSFSLFFAFSPPSLYHSLSRALAACSLLSSPIPLFVNNIMSSLSVFDHTWTTSLFFLSVILLLVSRVQACH